MEMSLKNRVLALILIASMALAVLPVFAGPTEPHAANAIWVEPSTLSFDTATTSVGANFTITIWENITTDDMFTWEVKIYYDKTQLSFIDGSNAYGDWASKANPGENKKIDGTSSVPFITGEDTGGPYLLWGLSLLGDDFIPAGTVASLMSVSFEIIAAPGKGQTLTSSLHIDNPDTYMLNPDLSSVTVTKYDATFTYTWSPPPPPYLAVDPTYREYGPYPPSAVGTLFDEKIYIKSLNSAWWLHNVTLHLAYNSTLLQVVSVTFDPLWTATSSEGTPGDLILFAGSPSTNPSGDVLVATVKFNITYQGSSPPRTPGEYDESPLDIHDYALYDTTLKIPTKPEVDGKVRIYVLITLPLAHFEVSSVTMGPEPVRGKEFNVDVSIKGLDPHWYLIGLQFRLSYPTDLIEPVSVTEGPFLKSFAAKQPGSLGTFFISYFETDGVYGPHVLVGVMIYPNASGWWNPPWPEGDGVVATITFRVIYQSYPENKTGPLNIIEQLAVGLDSPTTQNIVDVPLAAPVNGIYTILTALPGRMLDLYGGAVNEGYGTAHGYTYSGIGVIFPAPYGGQGLNNPMDMVVPQSQVWLFANVTYNYWPVQAKTVSFVVQDPSGNVWLKATAITDANGVAYTTFRMPWPCENPESLFGEWKVTATVTIGDVVMTDVMTFHYDYMVHIWKVTTDKYEYDHTEDVAITIQYGTHAMQNYPVLITAVIYDELGVPIGMATYQTTVGGAKYSTYKNYMVTLTINIPKFAYAGIATIHVNAFDKDPTEGGQAWCPEYTPAPEICIQPY
jgi:hypothetical protein